MPSKRIYRSSSMGFSLPDDVRPIESQVASWARNAAAASTTTQSNIGSNMQWNSVVRKSNVPITTQLQEMKKMKEEQARKSQISEKKQEESKRVIFTLGSYTPEEPHDKKEAKFYAEFAKFLEVCALCKKKIGGKDAYMYGYLQAFCSPECRDDRMILDERFRTPSPDSNATNRSTGNSAQQVIMSTHIKIHAVSKLNCIR